MYLAIALPEEESAALKRGRTSSMTSPKFNGDKDNDAIAATAAQRSHAIAASKLAAMAVELQRASKARTFGGLMVNMKVGLACGEVSAGIVGTKVRLELFLDPSKKQKKTKNASVQTVGKRADWGTRLALLFFWRDDSRGVGASRA